MSTTPLSIEEFAQRIKDKHPAYAQMDNADLTARVLKKYPEYTQAVTQAPQAPFPKGQGMGTGEGPIAQGLTSFESQLSNLPRNLWQGSFFGEIGNPQVRAAHEQRQQQEKQAMAQPGLLPGAKYAGSLINPVQKVDAGTPAERVDVGATGANLLPYAVAARSALNDVPIDRVAKAGGAAIKGGILNTPVVGRIARGAMRGAAKSWRESAPTTEIPPSKVSTTAPESSPAVSLNRLTSDIQSLGYSKADALARAKAGIAKYPNDLNAATTEAMRPSRAQAATAPTTGPPSKSAQVAQVRAAQTQTTQPTPQPQAPIPAVENKSTILPRMQQIAQQPGTGVVTREPSGPQTLIEGKPVPANTNLAPALEKSLPQTRVQGKIMQVLRKEGPNLTIGIDRLMKAPELQGLSREEVLSAAKSLRDSAKVWGHTAGPNEDIVGLALRKKP